MFKPGERFHYSSFGWNLIGAAIEGASGEHYLSYMKHQVWDPLGMTNTYGDIADSTMIHKSKFYDVTGEEAPFENLSYKYSGGGLLSTTEDLVKFGNALLHSSYFDATLVKDFVESQFTSDDMPTGYGLGWYVSHDRNGHRIWYHAGDLLNSSAFLVIYPDDDIVVAFLANSQQGLLLDIQQIGALFYQQ